MFSYLDVKHYPGWVYTWGCDNRIKIKQHDNIFKSRECINKIERKKGFEEINSLLDNLSIFLDDYLAVCGEQIEPWGKNEYHIKNFSDIDSSNRYQLDLEYNEYRFLIQDLLFELTRLLNLLLERIRIYEPRFLADYGIMTISGFDQNCVIYSDEEKKTLSPYPSLKEFVEKTRFTRCGCRGRFKNIKSFHFSFL